MKRGRKARGGEETGWGRKEGNEERKRRERWRGDGKGKGKMKIG